MLVARLSASPPRASGFPGPCRKRGGAPRAHACDAACLRGNDRQRLGRNRHIEAPAATGVGVGGHGASVVGTAHRAARRIDRGRLGHRQTFSTSARGFEMKSPDLPPPASLRNFRRASSDDFVYEYFHTIRSARRRGGPLGIGGRGSRDSGGSRCVRRRDERRRAARVALQEVESPGHQGVFRVALEEAGASVLEEAYRQSEFEKT
jgi:hypothetical protein